MGFYEQLFPFQMDKTNLFKVTPHIRTAQDNAINIQDCFPITEDPPDSVNLRVPQSQSVREEDAITKTQHVPVVEMDVTTGTQAITQEISSSFGKLHRSTRQTKTLGWMEDYITHKKSSNVASTNVV